MTPVGKAQKQNGKRGRRPAEFDVTRGFCNNWGQSGVVAGESDFMFHFSHLKRQKAHPSFPSRFFIGSMQFYVFD